MSVCISNPPYNMKWNVPEDASDQRRFRACVPPASNANYAFVLSALEDTDRCVFLLPGGVLSGGTKEEEEIRKHLVMCNYVEAVLLLPGNMFESTNIPTCILVLDKRRKTNLVEMIDLRRQCLKEEREQRGQYGGASHTKRVYKKMVNVIPDETIAEAAGYIKSNANIPSVCRSVLTFEIEQNDYDLRPSRYIEFATEEEPHRSYKDIVEDINRIIREKNNCKLTINESLGRKIGLDLESLTRKDDNEGLNELLSKLGADALEESDYFRTSKKANEVKFENGSKEKVSSIFVMMFNTWKQHIYYLNEEENRLLIELRDALLPELMNGTIDMDE